MKSLKSVMTAMAFVLAIGAAFATSSNSVLTTQVWERVSSTECRPTLCAPTGELDCIDANLSQFSYHTNANCTSTPIVPKEPLF